MDNVVKSEIPFAIQKFRNEDLLGLTNAPKGVEVPWRSRDIWFDEKSAVLLLDKLVDDNSGLSVGDEVRVDYQRVSPGDYTYHVKFTKEGQRQVASLMKAQEGYPFVILAFYLVRGKANGHLVEMTFCVLSFHERKDEPSLSGHGRTISCQELVCRGQELGRQSGKISLYWVGGLKKVEPSE